MFPSGPTSLPLRAEEQSSRKPGQVLCGPDIENPTLLVPFRLPVVLLDAISIVHVCPDLACSAVW